MLGISEEFLRITTFNNFASVHNDETIADSAHYREVVRNQQNGKVTLLTKVCKEI
jgi:hypothetical protein